MLEIWAKIADTPQLQSQGLMFVKNLPEDEGMIFVFNKSSILSFWGENTYIPLDIAFADKKGKIKKIDHIRPMDKRSVMSILPCKYAIELNEGFLSKNNIGEGDRIILSKIENGGTIVRFVEERNGVMRESQVIQEDILPEDNIENEVSNNLPIIDEDDIYEYLEDNQKNEDNFEEASNEIIPENISVNNLEEENNYDNIFNVSEEAEKEGKVLDIYYITDRGKYIEREVEPHGSFYATSTNRQILVTFDRTVGGIRAFIMKNIIDFSIPGESFEKKFVIV